ncbi:AraC-like DNA-binding protein [Lactobacillus colini]|uniref:AraC-like DNA-binding protein n=1 Tax=Lactobacillus colini TaxID=1819254 RepID=A0ABS4MCJ3_9LACO|nr:AraC family ligand binding domain-containing protein [Lactobacillus colini]MBP2057371.1 AraC-like DNA-binding protein [Lactobacillus colini]
MSGEYRTLSTNSLETGVVFFGKEHCLPNYFFTGNNVRENYIIHVITQGKGIFSSANHPIVNLAQGDIFILPKGVPCFYKADGQEPWSYFWLGLSGIKINTMLQQSSLGTKRYIKHAQNSNFYQSLTQLYNAVHNTHTFANDLLIESLIYQTFYYLNIEYPAHKESNKNKSDTYLNSAINYLHDNFEQHSCNINNLCHRLNVSRSYLYSLFKKEFNLSPQQYLTKIRMEEAKNKLNQSNLSIQQVSQSVGYTDEFTFSKAFKRYSGFSPKAYRQLEN